MKKLIIVCLCAYVVVSLSCKVVYADASSASLPEARVEGYISKLYQAIDFGMGEKLAYEVFDKACRGYLNLKSAGKLSNDKDIITVCDFNLPSTANRMWIIDLSLKKVLYNTYVAHGQGSGEDYAMSFSNKENSHQSSLGFFVTGDTYEGEHGTSLHLLGMDKGYNDAAFDRGIVVHGADYVSDDFIRGNERLGRSWGCPAVSPQLSLPIINTIKDGTCLFIYYPERRYMASSLWLNKPVATVPELAYSDLLLPAAPKPKVRVIQYIHNGKVDSVKTIPLGQ